MAQDAESFETRPQPPEMAGGFADLIRVGALGVNAWLVSSLIPFLWNDEPPVVARWTTTLVPAVLALGLWTLRRSQDVARWVLLAGVPIAMASAAATIPTWPGRPLEHAAVVALVAAAVCAYAAAAARACSMPVGSRPRAASPLAADRTGTRAGRRRSALRTAVLSVTALGAFAMAVIAPGWIDPPVLERDWGRAAAEASVLTAVMAGTLATVVMGLFVAPGMRRGRTPVRRARSVALRVGLLLLLALMGAYVHGLTA